MDHAGIATQMLVERQLASEGTSRQEVGRDAFLDRVWSWKSEKGGAIVEQLRRIGASCDWSREQFTLNEHMSAAVVEAFVRLHEMGVIYRGNRMVNWSPVLQTAVSDLEVEYSDQAGYLYHFKYVVEGDEDAFIPVATTRPETILGDSAVCVHPEDPRYRHLVGKKVLVPLQGRPVPVIADEYVDREFGTGALKITPAHDFNDFEIAQRHDLPFHVVIGLDGTMAAEVARLGSPQYDGLDREDCRRKLWADLEEAGVALKKEDHQQRVPLSQRSGEVIEPMLSDQWFVKTEVMAQKAMDVVESGDTDIQPDRYKKIWRGWLQEKQPWCISRQLWWGHRIPVYYPTNQPGSDRYFVGRSMEDALSQAREVFGEDVELRQDPDVLDTWFSSGLWPFATVGWPDESAPDFKTYYPATMLETGYDILFFWVARMVMMGVTLTGKTPFKEIYLHGLVRDEKGKKMSKTTGNVVDPLVSIEELGTDALRYALLTSSQPGMDTPLSKGVMDNAKSFANKIWNVGRFIIIEYEKNQASLGAELSTGMSFTEQEFRAMPWIERALLSRFYRMVESVTQALLQNRFAPPTKELKEFFQDDFSSWYLEASKTRLQQQLGGDPSSATGAVSQRVLLHVLEVSLQLLHPFMPYVTEAVWQRLPRGSFSPTSLMITPWLDLSSGALSDQNAEYCFDRMCSIVSKVRNARAEQEVAPKEKVALTIWCEDQELARALQEEKAVIAWLTKADVDQTEARPLKERGEGTPDGVVRSVVADGLEFDMLPPEKEVDVEKELQRLNKQLDFVNGMLAKSEKQITPTFLEKAPKAAVDKALAKKEEYGQQKAALLVQLEDLQSAGKQASRREALSLALAVFGLAPRPAQAGSLLPGAAQPGAPQPFQDPFAPKKADTPEEADKPEEKKAIDPELKGPAAQLPQGARQEDRIRRGLTKWKEEVAKIKAGGLTDDDWTNLQGFLRRLYSLAEDMKFLSRGFDKQKKDKAEELIEKFKKVVKASDKPAKAKDTKLFLSSELEITGYLTSFQDFLFDAGDDLVADEEEELVVSTNIGRRRR
jgi:valyl-tRNA synthetase